MTTPADSAVEVLRELQFDNVGTCPICHGLDPEQYSGFNRHLAARIGHIPDCRLHKALTAPAAAGQADEVAELRARHLRELNEVQDELDQAEEDCEDAVLERDVAEARATTAEAALAEMRQTVDDLCKDGAFMVIQRHVSAMNAAEMRAEAAEAALAASEAEVGRLMEKLHHRDGPAAKAVRKFLAVIGQSDFTVSTAIERAQADDPTVTKKEVWSVLANLKRRGDLDQIRYGVYRAALQAEGGREHG